MALPNRIFNGEDYRALAQNHPLSSQFENNLRYNTSRLARLKAERKYVVEVGLPKLQRDILIFQKLNYLSNMAHMGTATGIWLHRLVG